MLLKSTKSKGRQGEMVACTHLKNQGFKILDMNYTTKIGEIDIIALDNETLVFIEVKTAMQRDFGDPTCWIPIWKQQRIIRVSQVYMKTRGLDTSPMRFDVVTIDPDRRINHVRDAFRPRDNFFM